MERKETYVGIDVAKAGMDIRVVRRGTNLAHHSLQHDNSYANCALSQVQEESRV